MNKNLFIISLFLALAFVSYASFADMKNAEKVIIVNSKGERITFMLEIANTPDKQIKGLSNRDDLNEGEGMLFPAKTPKIFAMWMKDTLVPLDMLFIDEKGGIRHIHPMAKPHSERTISYDLPMKAVIELKGGIAEAKNIKEGDKVIHKLFLNTKN